MGKNMTKSLLLQNSVWQIFPTKMNKMITYGKYLFTAKTFTSASTITETVTHFTRTSHTYNLNNNKIRNMIIIQMLKSGINIKNSINCGLH